MAATAAPPPLTIDSHVDIPNAYMREARFDAGGKSVLQVDLDKMEEGGLDAAFLVIYVGQGPLDDTGYAKAVATAENKYSAIELLLARNPERIRLATTPAQVSENKVSGRLSALIGIENGYTLGHDLRRLDAAYKRGARYIGLVHSGNNDLCSSSGPNADLGEDASKGLSEFGRQVVRRANELGMMVDISHASDACILDVLAASNAPIIASHSSARALVNHARNLTDEQLRVIAAKGGVAQAVAYKEFVKADPARAKEEAALQKAVAASAGDVEWDSEKHEYLPAFKAGMAEIQARHPLATLEQFLDHIEHMVKVAGASHVGISGDFDGGGGVTGWMDASETGNVTAGLRRRGFSEAEIAGIWGGNLLRVWTEVIRRASPRTAMKAANPFDAMVDDVVARYNLPGIAVGVIQDGKVVYRGTRGELVAGSGERITPGSIFKIASNSKAMTASVLSRLVDAGKLKWSDPVSKHLPAFRMHDPWVSREMQVGDLLVHNSGLPEGGGDLMLWPEPNDFTRADIIAGLAHIKPAYSFRSGYAYDNLLYVVAGEVAAAVGGASYEELVRREIFAPLGLSGCRVGQWPLSGTDGVAQSHVRRDGTYVAADRDSPMVGAITSAAAGGIRCSLDDMLAWAGNWLSPTPSQLEWLSPGQRASMWQPRTPMPISARRRAWDNTHYYAYGYGFRFADVQGHWTVSHTGTLSGMYSVMTLLPDRRTGFVVLINADADRARTVMNQVLLDHFTSPESDRSVGFYADALAAESTSSSPTAAKPDIRVLDRVRVDAAALSANVGTYKDPWFGTVKLCPANGAVAFQSEKSPLLKGVLFKSGDRYLVDWDDESVDAEAWLRFGKDASGAPTFTMAKVDPDADFSYDYEDLAFARVASCD